MLRRELILLLLVATAGAGCGRRETPGALDAQPPAAAAPALAKPLPPSALQVRWGTLDFPRTVDVDAIVPVRVSLTNAGDVVWPDKAMGNPQLKDGGHAVRLTHAWIRGDDPQDGRIGAARTDLPHPLQPGESIELPVSIRTPVAPGEYRLRIELVQELVQWFANAGAETLTLPVHVGPGGPAGPAAPPAGQSPKAPARH